MSTKIPATHAYMPDGKEAVCHHYSDKKKSKLANAIRSARQVTLDEVIARKVS